MAQVDEISIVFDGTPETRREPLVQAGEFVLIPRRCLPSELGFIGDYPFCSRMLHILVALAVRRVEGHDDGWTGADVLSGLIEPESSADGVRKFLERRLRRYHGVEETQAAIDRLPKTHLVQYMPQRVIEGRKGGKAFGVSRGPYRLAPTPDRIAIDTQRCLDYLHGCGATTPEDYGDKIVAPMEALVQHRTLLCEGRYLQARRNLLSVVENALAGRRSDDSPSHEMLGRTFEALSEANMQLGLSNFAIHAADLALAHYAAMPGRPSVIGRAHVLQLKAHGLGQLGREKEALFFAERARDMLDNAVKRERTGANRARYVIPIGQYRSRLGGADKAQRELLLAERSLAEEGQWATAALAALRLSQNALRVGRDAEAENALLRCDDYKAPFMADRAALRTRVWAELMIRRKKWIEAETWAHQSREIGRQHGMRNHLRRLRGTFRTLEVVRSGP